MVTRKASVHYLAIGGTVLLALILLFAFAKLSQVPGSQPNGTVSTTIQQGNQSIGSGSNPTLIRPRTVAASGSNISSGSPSAIMINLTSTGSGPDSKSASTALESNIGAIGTALKNYTSSGYLLNVTVYSIAKTQKQAFTASSNITITVYQTLNASEIINSIDSIPNTTVMSASPQLSSVQLSSLRLQSIKRAVSNASSQVSFYLGKSAIVYTIYTRNYTIGIQPGAMAKSVFASSGGRINGTAIAGLLNSTVQVKGTASTNMTYSASPLSQNVSVGQNSITIISTGSSSAIRPGALLYIRINASGTTPQLATQSLSASLSKLNSTLNRYINGNLSLISTSDYNLKFYLSSTGPSFYALEDIVVTIPNLKNLSAAAGAVASAPNSFITNIGTGFPGVQQVAIVQSEISNLIANSTQLAKSVIGGNGSLYLASITIQAPRQLPQVYLNSSTSPSSIGTNSRIYNQSVYLNSTVKVTYLYSSNSTLNAGEQNLKLTGVGIASANPAVAAIDVHIEGNGTAGLMAVNSLLATLSQFNSTISKYINSNTSLVSVPNYTVSYNNSNYKAYMDVHFLLPNIANLTAVQGALGLIPNTTVTGVTPQLSQGQLSSLKAEALANAIAQAQTEISIALGGLAGIPQITINSQNYTVSQAPTVVSTEVSSEPVVVPTLGSNSTKSTVAATVTVTATVKP